MHLLTRPWDRIQFARSVTLNVWRALAVVCATGLASLSAAEALSFSGITEPILDAVMSSPVPGIVGTRAHQEGDFVEQGRLIMELDKKLEELEVSRRQALVVPLKADLEAHRALAKGTISVSVEMLEKKEAEYNVAFAEFELAKEQLRKRQIIAPFAGYIAELYREVGESCQANERLVRIVDTRRCYFVCNIEAKTGHRLKLGQQLPLEIEAGETPVKINGAIHFISPVVDPASGLLKIKLIFENTEGKIRPGVAGRLVLEDRAAGD